MIPEYRNWKLSWIERHESLAVALVVAGVLAAMWAGLKLICRWTGF